MKLRGWRGACLVKYLYENNGGFCFKRPVPKDLQDLVGRKVIAQHFKKTKDRRLAEKEALKLTVQTDELFDGLRRELTNQPRVQAKVKEILGPLFDLKFGGKSQITREDIAALREELEAQRKRFRRDSIVVDTAFLEANDDLPEDSEGVRSKSVRHEQLI